MKSLLLSLLASSAQAATSLPNDQLWVAGPELAMERMVAVARSCGDRGAKIVDGPQRRMVIVEGPASPTGPTRCARDWMLKNPQFGLQMLITPAPAPLPGANGNLTSVRSEESPSLTPDKRLAMKLEAEITRYAACANPRDLGDLPTKVDALLLNRYGKSVAAEIKFSALMDASSARSKEEMCRPVVTDTRHAIDDIRQGLTFLKDSPS